MTAPETGRGIGNGERAAEITTTFVGLPRDSFRILHVSTGNVCRSPITERLTRHAVQERLGVLGGGLIVESAGTWGHEGAPMEANAETVLTDFGADPAGFTGRELLDEHVIRADLVLTATRDHRAQVISMGHSAGLRTFTLKEFTRLVNAIDPATLPPWRTAWSPAPAPWSAPPPRYAGGSWPPRSRRTRSTTRTAPRCPSSAPSATRYTRPSTPW